MKKLIKKLIYSRSKTTNPHASSCSEGIPVFDSEKYADITLARINHLKSMNLPLSGRSVIDLGCGIGRFSEFFIEQGCNVFCVDGRSDNIQKLKELYPKIKAAVVDIETDEILKYGMYDIVFCYGLLYHLHDPLNFIKNSFKICKELLILETCITDAKDPVLRLVQEDQANASQALYGLGCRPSPSYVVTCLKLAGFRYVYTPIELPEHKQFQYKMFNDFSYLRKKEHIRAIFIASHLEMHNNNLRQFK